MYRPWIFSKAFNYSTLKKADINPPGYHKTCVLPVPGPPEGADGRESKPRSLPQRISSSYLSELWFGPTPAPNSLCRWHVYRRPSPLPPGFCVALQPCRYNHQSRFFAADATAQPQTLLTPTLTENPPLLSPLVRRRRKKKKSPFWQWLILCVSWSSS